jgi:glycosyltransferase involved in cell wall biosynthesis
MTQASVAAGRDRPVLEVVVPAHNAAPFLAETIAALAAQTRPAERVSIVDDRSRDDTRAIAEACRDRYAGLFELRVFANAGPPGPAAARNTAIRASTADIILLMDADDLAEPHHHASLLGALAAAPDIVLAFGNSLVFDATGVVIPDMHARSGLAGLPVETLAPGVLTLGERMFDLLLDGSRFTTAACAFRRDAALAAGLFDERLIYNEDTDFFLRLALVGRFAFVAEVVTRKRSHGGNLMTHSRFHFARGTALSLARLAADPSSLPAARRAALAQALRRAVYGHLYAASRSGFAAYREAVSVALRAKLPGLALDPRHLARLALSRFLPPLD